MELKGIIVDCSPVDNLGFIKCSDGKKYAVLFTAANNNIKNIKIGTKVKFTIVDFQVARIDEDTE